MATKRRKWIIGVVCGVALATILPVLAVLPWAASNAFAAGYVLIFTTKPSPQELAGRYRVAPDKETPELIVREDGTYQESISNKSKGVQTINGHWTSEITEEGNAAAVTLAPYVEVEDREWGRTFSYGTLNFYKPRLGAVYAELDPDTGSRFTKQ
jgi:hypothetical protein